MEREDSARCVNYSAGHQMHWIHWRQCGREGAIRVAGQMLEIDDDGRFVLELGGEKIRCWNHDPDRLRGLVESHGSDVVAVPRLHALVVDKAWVNYTTSFWTACMQPEHVARPS